MQNFLLLLGLLNFGEPIVARVRHQLRGQRSGGPHEQHSQFFQAGLALRGNQPRPPILRTEILARKGEFLEIIFEQQPRALGIAAPGEQVEQFPALGDTRFRIRQLAAQVGQCAIRLGKDRMMSVIFGRARETGRSTAFFNNFRHVSKSF